MCREEPVREPVCPAELPPGGALNRSAKPGSAPVADENPGRNVPQKVAHCLSMIAMDEAPRAGRRVSSGTTNKGVGAPRRRARVSHVMESLRGNPGAMPMVLANQADTMLDPPAV